MKMDSVEEVEEFVKKIAIDCAKHALGFSEKKPYSRHGRLFFKPYRNRFYTTENGPDFFAWEWMRRKGYADRRESGRSAGHYCYCVTLAGREWLGKELGMTIHHEIM